MAALAKQLGFEWGGDWTSFKDYPHLQMTFGLTTAQLQAGKRPTEQQVQEALAKINGNEPAEEQGISIMLNGRKLTTGLVENGTTYAPVRAVAEALGAKVTYDAASKTVNLVKE